jgi:hypothetical protein
MRRREEKQAKEEEQLWRWLRRRYRKNKEGQKISKINKRTANLNGSFLSVNNSKYKWRSLES